MPTLSLSAFNLGSLGVVGVTLLIGVSKGMASLIPGPIIIPLGVQLHPFFHGRVFGKLRSLRGWLFLCGQRFMGRSLHWIILCLGGAFWWIGVVCVIGMRKLWIILHCPIAHSLWVYMFQIFGTQWVMPGFVESLVYCWSFWLGKFNSNIWNMVHGCLMWIVWTERNRHSFEDTEKSLVQLQALCQKTLFDWSRCWGFLDCSTILEFISSLSIAL